MGFLEVAGVESHIREAVKDGFGEFVARRDWHFEKTEIAKYWSPIFGRS
jgi:hypothetical protein